MQAKLQVLERKLLSDGNGDLGIEHESFRRERLHRIDQFGKISSQGLSGFRLQRDFVVVAKGETAKTVPLWFVLPIGAVRDFVHAQRLHWREGRLDRQVHISFSIST